MRLAGAILNTNTIDRSTPFELNILDLGGLGSATTGQASVVTIASDSNAGGLKFVSNGVVDPTINLSAMRGQGSSTITYQVTAKTTFDATTTFTGDGNGIFTFSGSIDGAGGLVKIGLGTLSITGTSSYAGKTRISGGVLSLSGANATSGIELGGSNATLQIRNVASTGMGTIATLADALSSRVQFLFNGGGNFALPNACDQRVERLDHAPCRERGKRYQRCRAIERSDAGQFDRKRDVFRHRREFLRIVHREHAQHRRRARNDHACADFGQVDARQSRGESIFGNGDLELCGNGSGKSSHRSRQRLRDGREVVDSKNRHRNLVDKR
ncbi:MAG: autotransporter-associated beta strand repeat-containing protein [Pirellulales bacterium]